MDAAWGVDVDGGHREQQSPPHRHQAPHQPPTYPDMAAAHDVVGPFDRREQRVEVLGGPGLLRRGDEHERHRRSGDPPRQSIATPIEWLDDVDLALATSLGQEICDPLGDGPGRRGVAAGDRHDPHARGRHGVAPCQPIEQVVVLVVDHEWGLASHDATDRRNAARSRPATGPTTPLPTA